MKGISQEMWFLVMFILAFLFIGGIAWVFDAISSSGSAMLGCTNLHNIVAEATGVQLC